MERQVRERDIEEFEEKLSTMNTTLNKINYLESAVRDAGFSFEIKRYLLGKISELYAERKMFERAAKAMSNKAALEITFKDKINSYVTAAELYSQLGKVEDADQMFVLASRDADPTQKGQVRLARKNIYQKIARELESKGKKASAAKFYEKLLHMKLEQEELDTIKQKLITTYKSLGMFREAQMIERKKE